MTWAQWADDTSIFSQSIIESDSENYLGFNILHVHSTWICTWFCLRWLGQVQMLNQIHCAMNASCLNRINSASPLA
ncbi:hypothetical protein RchiOBHm_Chr2g0104511 [Rosa chinensis]|uniref:Uncharacterized protein n=1 Tax=Rosa chinensis TaxID=74649 RepID=A0A2P6RN69_ROSCH|nr:hypothetical protein RchiOBHm_Chr2g0104511 [Rosa chinensis]